MGGVGTAGCENKPKKKGQIINTYLYINRKTSGLEGERVLSLPLAPRRESEPELHEQHWFWIGLNRRDPAGDRSWRWSDGLGVSVGGLRHYEPRWHLGCRGRGGGQIRRWWKCPTPPVSLDPQFFYHNFDRSNYDDDDIRTCAVLDLASLQWMPMQCEAQLDWICKLPKGTRGEETPQTLQL